MPDYSTQNLLQMMGYEAGTLPELFGQHFEDPKDVWSQFLEPSFGLAGEALGELPELRRGMLGQLTSGLQERGATAGRELQHRRAGAGFAGAGALDRAGRVSRRGLGREYESGRWGIGQDIAKREAGILGGLSGQVGSFLQALLAGGAEPGEGDRPTLAGAYDQYINSGGRMSRDEWDAAGRPVSIDVSGETPGAGAYTGGGDIRGYYEERYRDRLS